jgi:hypothetical protein
MNSYAQPTTGLGTADRLDQIRLSPDQRRMARASVRQAEWIAEMLMHAIGGLRRLLEFLRRGISAPAHRRQVSAAAPEWRLP